MELEGAGGDSLHRKLVDISNSGKRDTAIEVALQNYGFENPESKRTGEMPEDYREQVNQSFKEMVDYLRTIGVDTSSMEDDQYVGTIRGAITRFMLEPMLHRAVEETAGFVTDFLLGNDKHVGRVALGLLDIDRKNIKKPPIQISNDGRLSQIPREYYMERAFPEFPEVFMEVFNGFADDLVRESGGVKHLLSRIEVIPDDNGLGIYSKFGLEIGPVSKERMGKFDSLLQGQRPDLLLFRKCCELTQYLGFEAVKKVLVDYVIGNPDRLLAMSAQILPGSGISIKKFKTNEEPSLTLNDVFLYYNDVYLRYKDLFGSLLGTEMHRSDKGIQGDHLNYFAIGARIIAGKVPFGVEGPIDKETAEVKALLSNMSSDKKALIKAFEYGVKGAGSVIAAMAGEKCLQRIFFEEWRFIRQMFDGTHAGMEIVNRH